MGGASQPDSPRLEPTNSPMFGTCPLPRWGVKSAASRKRKLIFRRTRERSCAFKPVISSCSIQILPVSGLISDMISFRVTLFPVPLHPSTHKASPAATSKATSRRTCFGPNDFETHSKERAGLVSEVMLFLWGMSDTLSSRLSPPRLNNQFH
jgi:hypothetical protein